MLPPPSLLLLLLLAGPCRPAPAVAGSTPVGAAAAANSSSLPALLPAKLAALAEDGLRLLSSRLSLLGAGAAAGDTSAPAREAATRGVWSALEALLKAVLNAIRLLIDPAPLGSYELSFNNSLIKGHLAANGVLARHLRDVQLHVGLPSPLTGCAEVRVAFPLLGLKAYYDADLSVALDDGSGEFQRIFGAGRAKADLRDVRVTTNVCLAIKVLSVRVTGMKISLQKAEVELRGLFGERALSALISGIISDVLPGGIEEYQSEITQLAMKYINEYIRRILHGGRHTTAARIYTPNV